MTRTADALVSVAPQRMREHLDTDDRVKKFCDRLFEDVDDRECPAHRTAMRLYAEIMQAVGGQVNIAVNIWQQLGISDATQGKAMMDAAIRASDLDQETAWRISEQFVQDYRRENGLPELIEARPQLSQEGQ